MRHQPIVNIPFIGNEFLTDLLKALPYGKRVGHTVYVYREALRRCAPKLSEWVEKLAWSVQAGPDYNVVKFTLSAQSAQVVSFLSYPNFMAEPHPALRASVTIHLATGKVTCQDYSQRTNPPILHRKETLVEESHPHYAEWRALTEIEEKYGLYEKPFRIGFRKNWEGLLARKGLRYEGHRLIACEKAAETPKACAAKEAQEVVVKRHKTALVRYRPSKPIQCLLSHGLLSKESSLLDYGCGRGDDIRYLTAMGYRAVGWDPVYRPHGPKEPADIVNLGYVLNVIEDPEERVEVLRDAFALARSLLVVSVQTVGSSSGISGRPYRDGILTNRQTFQKYFHQHELENFIEETLGVTGIPTALGIFYVFKNPGDLQNFLSQRNRSLFMPSTWDWKAVFHGTAAERGLAAAKRGRWQWLYEQNQELLNAFWQKSLELGRLPLQSEFERYGAVTELFGSPKKALRFLTGLFGTEVLEKAAESRRNDLLVYIALSNFRKRVPFGVLPDGLQADIRHFLGPYSQALAQGRQALFAAGDSDLIAGLCNDSPLGHKDDRALYVHSSLVADLHPVLRVYVGCAELLCGDVKNADLVKIHKHSGKLTLLFYDDFFGKPFPELQTRVKVNLRTCDVDVFDHRSELRQELLFFKERYVRPDHPDRETWAAQSRALQEIGVDLEVGYGPCKQELLQLAVRYPWLRSMLDAGTGARSEAAHPEKETGFAGKRSQG